MNKRYQVFVSSTYADLKEERQRVIQTLMEMDCIPSGMELFPAADEEQLEFIKRVIDDCDYYLLIIGGRYGSIANDGLSYTEQEYDYAIEKGIKVIALLHQNPDAIPMGRSESDKVLRERLSLFRQKVSSNRLVKFWNNANDLPGLVALSLSKAIKLYPSTGWIRGDNGSSEELFKEINQLRKENQKLINQQNPTRSLSKLDRSILEKKITISFSYQNNNEKQSHSINAEFTWKQIFDMISLELMIETNSKETLMSSLINQILEFLGLFGTKNTLSDYSNSKKLHDILKIQLLTLEFIKVTSNPLNKVESWILTDKGYQEMIRSKSIKENFSIDLKTEDTF